MNYLSSGNNLYPDNMNILAQRWFPIGDIGVGVLFSSHIGSILGFSLVILALTISCREILFQYWLAIGTCDIGFITAPNNGIILAHHIGNRQATNIEPIVGIMLAQYWLKTNYFLKLSRVRKQQNDIQVH